MKYRGKEEIIGKILETAQSVEGITRTKIMYSAFLSYTQLKEYLKLCTEKGLLEPTKEGLFKTTNKGQTFLSNRRENQKILA